MGIEDKIFECGSFDWDKGNWNKNWLKHGVSVGECEQVFFNSPLIFGYDEKHSPAEERHYALGKTDGGRLLFVVFTIRKNNIRVISARDMTKKEKGVYEKL
jgi:uncharacterized DUF497 family protein